MKADYAEATGTHNTGNANYVGTLYDVKTPPQEADSRVRTTIFGFPSVIFHKKDESSEPEFIGKYNYNFDKGAENVFGFSSDYPLAECWEFKNNTSDPCLFHGEVTEDNWSANFEARYPDEYDNISAFKVMHSWVVSTWQDGATGTALASTYTDVDGKTYTTDTAEYRLAKFKTEFEDHFDKRFMTIYYLYTLVMLMVDQRAKNMFLTTWDGVKWEPWLYDNDTCLGINNEGELVFDYYHEDIDLLENANVFNGQDSALWVNFRECFADDIQALYKSWRSDGKLTFQSIYDAFITNQSNKWSISVYNEDADYKYISMLRSDGNASNLNQIRGSGAEHLGYFVDNRLNYLDSKFDASAYHDNYATLRIYTPKTWAGVTPNANVTVTPYSDMYAGIRYKANGEEQKIRAKANVPVTFTAPQDEEFNDTETAVFGASEISSLGDLSPLYCGTIEVDKATKLTEIICGSGVSGYSNTNMKKLVVGTNKLLRKVDVRNCPSLTAPLALANCPNMEEIYAEGTSITGLELPDSGYLKVVHLPDTITNLTMVNQPHITDFTCAGYGNVTSLRVENSPIIPTQDIVTAMGNGGRLRLIDFDWTLESIEAAYVLYDKFDTMKGIDEQNNTLDKAVLYGKIYVPYASGTDIIQLKNRYPNIEIEYLYIAYAISYYNEDGTELLAIASVDGAGNGKYPNETPTKESTAQYSYTFQGWSLTPGGNVDAEALRGVTADRNVYASFFPTVRSYTVRFYNGTELLQTSTVSYGGSTAFTGTEPTRNDVSDPEEWTFSGWNPEPSNIVCDTDCYAQYFYSYITDSWKEIAAASDDGTYAERYIVGQKKSLSINYTDGSADTVEMMLAGIDVDDLADETGKAHLSFVATNPLVDTCAYSKYSVAGLWSDSVLKTKCDEVYNCMQEAVKPYIKNIKTVIYEGSSYNTYTDYVRVPSRCYVTDIAASGVTSYPIFTDNTSRILKTSDGTLKCVWWCPHIIQNTTYYLKTPGCVKTTGEIGVNASPTAELYVRINFCI